jgi:hypothetical protein
MAMRLTFWGFLFLIYLIIASALAKLPIRISSALCALTIPCDPAEVVRIIFSPLREMSFVSKGEFP